MELNIFDRIAGPKLVLLTTGEFGRIEELTGPIKFTVVNQKPIYLVISVENQLVDCLEIRNDFIRS